MVYFCMGLSGFPRLGVYFLSHVSEVFFFFFNIISSNIFSYPFFFSSFSRILTVQMLVCLMLSRVFQNCCHFFSFFFLHSALLQLFPPFFLPGHLSVLLPQLFCYWVPLVYFFISVLILLIVCSLFSVFVKYFLYLINLCLHSIYLLLLFSHYVMSDSLQPYGL